MKITTQPFEAKKLADGTFSPAQIILSITDEYLHTYSPEVRSKLELLWQEKLLDAEQKGYQVWNSQSYALKDVKLKNGLLHLNLGLVEYKYQAGVAQLIQSGELDRKYATRLMYSGLLIHTIDDKWIFGIGSKHVYIGEIKFIGGSYSKDEHVLSSGQSLFDGAITELGEEINVLASQISQIRLRRIYATPKGMRTLVFVVMLNIDAQTVKTRFSARKDKELADILILEPSEAREALSKLEDSRRLVFDLIK